MRYDPGAVPSLPESQQAFLQNELQRIADAINFSPTYGGLRQIGGQALAITATPQKLPFTAALPNQNITPDVANDEFTIAEAGDYQLFFSLNAAVSASILLTLEAYVDGSPSGQTFLLEVITQANGANAAASTIITVQGGEVLSLWVSGSPNRTVTFDNVNYYAQRVS